MLPRKSIWLPQLSKKFLMGKRGICYKSINFFNEMLRLVDKPVWREKALSSGYSE